MNRLLVGAMALALGVTPATAQSLEDLNIQIHGYATQGFLYTTNNNILTTSSSNGSPAWTEAVVNVGAQPIPKLRVGVQARYFLLGNIGNAITLDWAAADYKLDERFGARLGKVKTPAGLFNEIQDIDPGYLWSLLPQGIYPITSRNSILAHYGGVAYGTLKLGPNLGKLEYCGWGGERAIGSGDGYLLSQREEGITLPNGLNGILYGGALHWRTPLAGLTIGASDMKDNAWNSAMAYANPIAVPGVGTIAGPFSGTETVQPFNVPDYFARYERDKVMVAGEWARLPYSAALDIVVPALVAYGIPYVQTKFRMDQKSWFGMASYKVTDRFTAGVYQSQSFNVQAPLGPARYSKDWALSARYDFNQFLYAKAEQHFIDGAEIGYDAALNPNGLQPNTKLTILKIGVSF
jgi:hypothetical protein